MSPCAQCGAVPRAGAGRFCAHCGALMPDAPALDGEAYRTHPERFATARADARYAQAMQRLPVVGGRLMAIVAALAMMGFGAVFGYVWLDQAPGFMRVVGVAFIGLWELVLVFVIAKVVRFYRAPVTRVIAVVVDKRSQTSGGGKDSVPTTTYFATLAYEDGAREELTVEPRLSGALTVGDIGLAYRKLDRLVDYARLDEKR